MSAWDTFYLLHTWKRLLCISYNAYFLGFTIGSTTSMSHVLKSFFAAMWMTELGGSEVEVNYSQITHFQGTSLIHAHIKTTNSAPLKTQNGLGRGWEPRSWWYWRMISTCCKPGTYAFLLLFATYSWWCGGRQWNSKCLSTLAFMTSKVPPGNASFLLHISIRSQLGSTPLVLKLRQMYRHEILLKHEFGSWFIHNKYVVWWRVSFYEAWRRENLACVLSSFRDLWLVSPTNIFCLSR